ncbi:hypothetical protein [Methylomonas koyamae]|uniref:hypothetical protein n=1 Tax=Methylomonas koyamae TaxID=702114 RepID=UPI0006D1691A|nr:hypothetical protein [Methylomonas koyamae]BBL57267.1 hypothetical protein MKFW12EY_08800 [Methylomonas koyamae]
MERRTDETAYRTPVNECLFKVARDCILADEYYQSKTRAIAEKADINVAMIEYQFRSNQELSEAVIARTLQPL